MEALEQLVRETTEMLKETEQSKVAVEKELKAAVEKVSFLLVVPFYADKVN